MSRPSKSTPAELTPTSSESSSDPSGTPDDLARVLSQRSAWDDQGASVEWIQTHISHVFLVGDRVFKLRKAVQLPFLDFATRDHRNADCLRELSLNRRLAASVYLGIAPILVEGDSVHAGPLAQEITDPTREHLVVMRRLPAGRDALALIEKGAFTPNHIDPLCDVLARFHDAHSLGTPAPWSTQQWFARAADPILESLTLLSESGLVERSRLDALETKIRTRLAALAPTLEARRLAGRAVDAHGDLHLDHIWYEDDLAEPLLIDCVEFNDDLRHIDRASEVAFLAMDLRYRGCNDLAEYFLSSYAALTDDYEIFELVDFFAAYRALVRAKVAALAATQPSIAQDQRAKARASVDQHTQLAEELLETRVSGGIILLCGTVGSGKSTVARRLARQGRGISISSDRVRKSLAGLSAEAHPSSRPDEGLYEAKNKQRVYRALLERAQPVVASGRTALLDASFSRRVERDLARSWAEERGLDARLVEVRCKTDVALQRLQTRFESGLDPSDAGPDFLPISEARFEPPDEWPSSSHEVVSTD